MPAVADPRPPGPQLTLDFRARRGIAGLGADGYDVIATNADGAHLLELHLPPDLVERAVLPMLGISVAISPESLVSVQTEELGNVQSESNYSPIDTLVAQAVEPTMLEDESEVREMLTTLRERLRRASESVDIAIARIEDQP